MSCSATSQFDIPSTVSDIPFRASRVWRNRSSRSRRALKTLGHAIEYLTDEFLIEFRLPPSERKARLDAIALLMAMNRQVYFECPQTPSLRHRFLAFSRQLI